MIVFNQPYHVSNVDILGTFHKKMDCVTEQNRAITIGTIIKTSFGCVYIEKIKPGNNHASS